MPSHSPIVHLHEKDSVVVALRDLKIGETLDVSGMEIRVRDAIPAGHKLAIQAARAGDPVVKFGWPIGMASQPIEPGQHVHTQNVRCEHQVDLQAIATELPEIIRPTSIPTFHGYHRASGKVGTRNYVAVISNVNCSASVAKMIARQFPPEYFEQFENVDGIVAFRHEGGCAMKWEGSRHKMLSAVLGGMAKHPNIGGFLLVGLGCEQGTLDHLVGSQKLHSIEMPTAPTHGDDHPAMASDLPMLTIQAEGGTQATVKRGTEIAEQLIRRANNASRSEASASELILATECGGSDGYSGISANPALGNAVDRLVACGGTGILAETSEIFGAEHLLTRRARSKDVAERLLEKIQWWHWYAGLYGENLDNNPSVGNKAGGLTTITEKSLGAVSKGGTMPLEAVYDYAAPVDKKGFVVMDSPGFDPASVTGMVAGGANLVAFTTGRGSCFGFKPTPSLKIASNTSLYERLPDDMDFNAGRVLEGESIESVGADLFDQLLRTASGEKTCSEQLGLGDEEFVPWLVGPVL